MNRLGGDRETLILNMLDAKAKYEKRQRERDDHEAVLLVNLTTSILLKAIGKLTFIIDTETSPRQPKDALGEIPRSHRHPSIYPLHLPSKQPQFPR